MELPWTTYKLRNPLSSFSIPVTTSIQSLLLGAKVKLRVGVRHGGDCTAAATGTSTVDVDMHLPASSPSALPTKFSVRSWGV